MKETTQIIKELRDIIKDLKPVKEIQCKINNITHDFEENNVDVFISGIHVVHSGCSIPYLADAVVSSMNAPEVKFEVGLNSGKFESTAWGCDLTEEYVTFNSAYST